MCLLKVYLSDGGGQRLLAEDIALIVKEGDGFKLLGLDLASETVLGKVDVSLVDTLNSILIFEPKR